MRAQASAEFLVIVAVLTFVMVPLLLVVYLNTTAAPERLALSKATFSAARLSSAANSVGSMGLGARLYTTIEIPDVKSVEALDREIVITVKTTYGDVQIAQPTRHRLSGVGLDRIKAAGTYTLDVIGPSNYAADAPVTIKLR